MCYQYAGKLRPCDQLYLFAPPRFLRLLDRFFASPAPLESSDTDFFGAFTVMPEKSLRELKEDYELPIDDQDAGGESDLSDLSMRQ
jgi:cell volume regulation protein A